MKELTFDDGYCLTTYKITKEIMLNVDMVSRDIEVYTVICWDDQKTIIEQEYMFNLHVNFDGCVQLDIRDGIHLCGKLEITKFTDALYMAYKIASR